MKLWQRDKITKYLRTVERSRVVVHTLGGSSIEGVLVGLYSDCLVLAHASALSGSGRLAIDGESIIERRNVDWIQKLGPGEEV